MRPLHAVLVERATPRLVELLAAALDGTGPAIAPLDAGLPPARLAGLIDALRPGSVVDTEGVTTARSGPDEGVAEGTAVVVGTSGSTGVPKGVELSAAALRHSARASLDRVGARPGERWLCCLPVTHVAGLAVLVRSLVSGTEPVLAERADAGTVAASGCAHVSLVPTQLQRLLQEAGAPLAGFSSVLLGGAAAPAGLLDAARDAGVPLRVRGRADDVINTGGHKVVPSEVAAALQACPGVRDAAVVGQPDPEWGERVVAAVVPADPGDPPALEMLRSHVRERLPRYAIPSRVVMVDAVPMLPSGKHDIVRLRQELLRREQTEAESVIY